MLTAFTHFRSPKTFYKQEELKQLFVKVFYSLLIYYNFLILLAIDSQDY